jgi:hypothetical protein
MLEAGYLSGIEPISYSDTEEEIPNSQLQSAPKEAVEAYLDHNAKRRRMNELADRAFEAGY